MASICLERKAVVAKHKRKMNDKRMWNGPKESRVFYVPITKYLATRLGLIEDN